MSGNDQASAGAVGRFAMSLWLTGIFSWLAAALAFTNFNDPTAGILGLGVGVVAFGWGLHSITR